MARKPFPLLPAAWESPSKLEHGIDPTKEVELRYRGTVVIDDLIRRLGDPNMLQPGSGVRCTAHYYFQAFYLYKSLKTEDSGVVGLAAVFLACKVTEFPRKMRDICRVYQVALQETWPGLELNEREQFDLRECVTRIEGFLLRAVDFILRPPAGDFLGSLEEMKHLVLQCLRGVLREEFAAEICMELCSKARAFMYDSFAGLLPHKYEPAIVVAGCLFIAFCYQQSKLTTQHPALNQPWSTLFPRLPTDKDLLDVKTELILLFKARKKQQLEPPVVLDLPDQSSRKSVSWSHGSQKRMSPMSPYIRPSPATRSSANSVAMSGTRASNPAQRASGSETRKVPADEHRAKIARRTSGSSLPLSPTRSPSNAVSADSGRRSPQCIQERCVQKMQLSSVPVKYGVSVRCSNSCAPARCGNDLRPRHNPRRPMPRPNQVSNARRPVPRPNQVVSGVVDHSSFHPRASIPRPTGMRPACRPEIVPPQRSVFDLDPAE